MKVLRNTFFSHLFFILNGAMVFWFCAAYFIPVLYVPGLVMTGLLGVLVLIDWILLYSMKLPIEVSRDTPRLLSMGDNNAIRLVIRNKGKSAWKLDIADELPVQLQKRDFILSTRVAAYENKELTYEIQPLERGEYHFGRINVLMFGRLKLVKRLLPLEKDEMVKVYPSIIQMAKFELYTNSKLSRHLGIKKLRRIGMSYEFEQIKYYVQGDDIRQINWKASGKHQQLMVNQHDDEKSQPIYTIIDKSRIMLMPFNGMSLMDHAINTSLVISNVSLKKQDKAGLITFSDKIGAVVKADNKHNQLQTILEALYNQKERNLEADYELLYQGIRNMIKTRSLLFLYTNFESMYALQRVLPILRKINQQHLLIVVFFENSEIEDLSKARAKDLKGVYTRIMAEQAISDKYTIAQELNNIGIQTILTKPEDLSLNSINKYLEIKARGMV